MKSIIVSLALTITLFLAAAMAQEPAATPSVVAPVVIVPNAISNITSTVLAVLAGLGTVVTAIALLLANLKPQLASMKATIDELRGRADRQDTRAGGLQKQVTDNARAIVPTEPPTTGATTTSAITGLLIAGFLCLSQMGCATDTGNPTTDKRGRITNAVLGEVFNAVVQVGLSEGRSALMGQNGQDAANAAFEAAGSIDGAAAINHILKAAAGPQIAPVANVVLAQVAKAKTPADRVAILNTVGAALQNVNGQLAAQ